MKYYFFIALLLISSQLSARSFQIREQNPLALIHGLPLPGDSEINAGKNWSSEVLLNISNTLNPQVDTNESLMIDGETIVLDLILKKRIASGFSIGLHIPLISHNSGILDNFIVNYHDALGLPQGDRERLPNDQLLFQYIRDDVTLLEQSTSSSGPGDIRILLAHPLKKSRQFAISAQASVKLPSGDSQDMSGSGALDLAAWLNGQYQWNNRWHSNWHAGLLWMGQGDILPDQQNDFALFFGGSLAWELTPVINLQVQADWHSALYDDSELKLLGPSLNLTTGGTIDMGSYGELAIAVLEDIDVGSAPDVQFHIGWRQKY